jgi:hypothetical protein
MKGLLQRVTAPFREFGVLDGALYVANRALNCVSARLSLYVYELMVQPISDKALLPRSLAKNLTYSEIGLGHPDLAKMPAHEHIKNGRFDQGAKCLGVYRKGELVGYSWFCFHSYKEDEVRCTYVLGVPAKSVFDFDFFVMPEFRLGIGFMAVWHCANLYLRERGVDYTFSRLTRFNTASRRAHAHLGWKNIGRAIFLQAWRTEIMVANVAPYFNVSWSRTSRVSLNLLPVAFDGQRASAT